MSGTYNGASSHGGSPLACKLWAEGYENIDWNNHYPIDNLLTKRKSPDLIVYLRKGTV